MQRPRTPSRISDSLHRQLNSYALAASAAGVGMLALTRPAEAKIVYTRARQQIYQNIYYALDLNHDGIADVFLENTTSSTSLWVGGSVLVSNIGSNAEVGIQKKSYAFPSAFALDAGVRVGANRRFVRGQSSYRRRGKNIVFMADSGFFNGRSSVDGGQWLNVRNRYLGIKFDIKGQTHYGWARLDVGCANRQCNVWLTGYAYETIPNRAIIAGKTKGPDVITVEGAGLGHLARGRRQRNSDR